MNLDTYFKYNSERYYDPTAYVALSNVQKGEKMINDKVESRIGEIWEIGTKFASITYKGLIIADNGNIVTCIKLIDEENSNCDIEVICQGKMYACSRMIQYTFDTSCETFIRKLTDFEFKNIMDKVASSLGIQATGSNGIKNEADFTALKFTPPVIHNMTTDIELERTKAQLEVYKGLYEELFRKMVG